MEGEGTSAEQAGSGPPEASPPGPLGCRLRAGAVLAGTEDFGGGRQVTLDLTFEIEGTEKPACVAQVVYRFYG